MNEPRLKHDIKIPADATKEEIEEFVREYQTKKQIIAPSISAGTNLKELILTLEEQDGMRAAGAFNAQLMDHVRTLIGPGTVLEELDDEIENYTRSHGHIPACQGYLGYPKSSCMSVNNVICHGIPDGYILQDGDIVNVDLTTIVDGWHGDQSETFLIGEVSDHARKLVQCSFDAMWAAIKTLRAKSKIEKIGRAIEEVVHPQGFSVVKHFQGHGIGRKFHQEPHIPHFFYPPLGKLKLRPGICFTIEPMVNAGKWEAVVDKKDKWTARTIDGALSAQFEHTILMTKQGPEVLTLTKNGPQHGHKF
ncbi:MAG: type I methionyl aminopeptidase [Candidatus Thorarchaeota archaeon]|jgi:methionyl aminopeptidase